LRCPLLVNAQIVSVPVRCFTHHGDHGSADTTEWKPTIKEWMETGKRKPSKYPVPPVSDVARIMFQDDNLQNPEVNPNLPWTIDRSEGVTVLVYKEGKYKGEEIVLAHGQPTLEWCLPSPPPLHQMDESPIIKEHPDYVD